MPYCLKCHAEFRDGFTLCNTCGLPLMEGEAPKKDQKKHITLTSQEVVCIYTVNDSFEANQILAILKDNGIYAYAKGKGSSGYIITYTGFSCFGTMIYVDKYKEREAKELVEVFLKGRFELENEIKEEDFAEEYKPVEVYIPKEKNDTIPEAENEFADLISKMDKKSEGMLMILRVLILLCIAVAVVLTIMP